MRLYVDMCVRVYMRACKEGTDWKWQVTFREVPFLPQTLKSAIGMKESEETAGLASPKLTRQDKLTRVIQVTVILTLLHLDFPRHHASDMLLGKAKKVSLVDCTAFLHGLMLFCVLCCTAFLHGLILFCVLCCTAFLHGLMMFCVLCCRGQCKPRAENCWANLEVAEKRVVQREEKEVCVYLKRNRGEGERGKWIGG